MYKLENGKSLNLYQVTVGGVSVTFRIFKMGVQKLGHNFLGSPLLGRNYASLIYKDLAEIQLPKTICNYLERDLQEM